jgi:hypothetical protein
MSATTPTQPGAGKSQSDYYSWAIGQARALRDHQVGKLDWENLAEEVEDLANRNADAWETKVKGSSGTC